MKLLLKELQRQQDILGGVSEETGKSIRLLELFSLPGIKHLNEYFNEKNKSKFEINKYTYFFTF